MAREERRAKRLFNTVNALCAQPGRANARFLFVRVNPHFHYIGSVLFDVSLHETHRRLLALLDRLCAADLKIGVRRLRARKRLAFIGYDQDAEGALQLFQDTDTTDTPSYAQMYQECVIHVS